MPLLALVNTFIHIALNKNFNIGPNCTLKANLKRPISQATKSEVRP